MSKKNNISSLSNIEWIHSEPHTETRTLSSLIEDQIRTTGPDDKSLLQEVLPGIFLLTIPAQGGETPLSIKKISDRVQYGILSEKHNHESIIRLSYFQIRNLCHLEPPCSWAKAAAGVFVFFFYHLPAVDSLFSKLLQNQKYVIKERLSNRFIIISDDTYDYPFNLSFLVAFCLWREAPLEEVAHRELLFLKQKFKLFAKLIAALKQEFSNYSWEFTNGILSYLNHGQKHSFDYSSLCDDIIYAGQGEHIARYLKGFALSDVDSSLSFPTISVRSLVHLKARPNTLSSLQHGYALCAAKEQSGKQTPIEISSKSSFYHFNLWHKRALRHLFRHQYQARVVLIDDEQKQTFSLVGEQVATIAVFPKLIKGVLEQLNFKSQESVRLIAHNEDVLTIATEEASWNDINEVNRKAMSLFKMISTDGADPISFFEQVSLPAHGVGTFTLSLVPQEYFELIDTAFTLKYSMPPGHDHYLLGLSYECLREWSLAVSEFEKALRLDSKDPSILNALGSALMEMGHYEKALPFLKRAYDVLTEDAELANMLGKLHLSCGKLDDAILAFERAVRLSPGSADFLANLGQGYALAARPLDALEMLNKAIRCNPSFAAAHERLAHLHLQRGDEELAKRHALIAYRENPVDSNIANLLWQLTVGKNEKNNS